MVKKIDDTIEAICTRIQEILKAENIEERSNVPELVKALAELIYARKSLG